MRKMPFTRYISIMLMSRSRHLHNKCLNQGARSIFTIGIEHLPDQVYLTRNEDVETVSIQRIDD